MNNEQFAQVDNYISNLLGEEDEILKSIEPALYAIDSPMAYGSISANQGKFLQVMAQAANAKRILELGTLGGYSTIWMARALPKDGKLITVEYDAKHAAVAQEHINKAGLSHKIELRISKCMDVLDELIANNAAPFDMMFMDADKPPYTEYFQKAVQLSRKGTIIIADNVVRGGKVLNPAIDDAAALGVQRFNKMLSENKQVSATILQNVGIKDWDGMAIAVVL
ncbi:MAG: O-methyltransferase [Bacteroidetes bacterium]|nr:O-methyltransferase [Bacteroidota bacterium]